MSGAVPAFQAAAQEVDAVDHHAALCLARAMAHFPPKMELPGVGSMWSLRFLHFQQDLKPRLVGAAIAKHAVTARAKAAKVRAGQVRKYFLPSTPQGLQRVFEGMKLKGLDLQLADLARMSPCDRRCCVNSAFGDNVSLRSEIIKPRVETCVEPGCEGGKLSVNPPPMMRTRQNRNEHARKSR